MDLKNGHFLMILENPMITDSPTHASRADLTEHRVVVLPLENTAWMSARVTTPHPSSFTNGPSQIRNLCDGDEDARQAAAQQAASDHPPAPTRPAWGLSGWPHFEFKREKEEDESARSRIRSRCGGEGWEGPQYRDGRHFLDAFLRKRRMRICLLLRHLMNRECRLMTRPGGCLRSLRPRMRYSLEQ
ncbi:hypothetical protein E2C01_002060 [Portunus trituberculatus]|uniref:Uncharacterized protein n=1 Tax=Portunus trituberculatus TaxID=210409 RepID=A0A5B7CJY9_PORTR|nr:hypothetical protein [Portunus trituberculatus]